MKNQINNYSNTPSNFITSQTAQDSEQSRYAYGATRINSLSDTQLAIKYAVLNGLKCESTTEIADIRYTKEKILEEYTDRFNRLNRVKWPYIESPFFTEEETEFYKSLYAESDADITSHPGTTNRSYGARIVELQDKIKNEENPDEINALKQQLVDMGWNPEVEYGKEVQEKAKQRIEEKYTEELFGCVFLNIQEEANDIRSSNIVNEHVSKIPFTPVYIMCYENGDVRISIAKPEVDPARKMNVDVYSVFCQNKDIESCNIKEQCEQTLYATHNPYSFILPSNVYCARTVKKIKNVIGGNESVSYIYSVYSGKDKDFQKAYNSISHYVESLIIKSLSENQISRSETDEFGYVNYLHAVIIK